MRRALPAICLLALLSSDADAAGRSEEVGCLSPGDTIEVVTDRKVVAPADAIGLARRAAPGAELLRAALCHGDGTLVFRITMLRRDGRVVRVTVDALSGKLTVLR